MLTEALYHISLGTLFYNGNTALQNALTSYGTLQVFDTIKQPEFEI